MYQNITSMMALSRDVNVLEITYMMALRRMVNVPEHHKRDGLE